MAEGALRCLKRRLSDVVFRQFVAERALRNPGGQMGATLTSSPADLIPHGQRFGDATTRAQHRPYPALHCRVLTQRGTYLSAHGA